MERVEIMNDDLDAILNNTFAYAKKCARDFYFYFWAPQPPHCPAFEGGVIYISHFGWEHLVCLRRRTKFELLGRFIVLERANRSLETATHFQLHIQRGILSFWIFEAEVAGVRIKVVVRSVDRGDKHFYSVIRKGSVEKEIA